MAMHFAGQMTSTGFVEWCWLPPMLQKGGFIRDGKNSNLNLPFPPLIAPASNVINLLIWKNKWRGQGKFACVLCWRDEMTQIKSFLSPVVIVMEAKQGCNKNLHSQRNEWQRGADGIFFERGPGAANVGILPRNRARHNIMLCSMSVLPNDTSFFLDQLITTSPDDEHLILNKSDGCWIKVDDWVGTETVVHWLTKLCPGT